jgi:hypothetical protein
MIAAHAFDRLVQLIEVDLAASDEQGAAVVRVTWAGRL